jgi:GTP:adenosylcobinamide-phosphate guanylyltransferase
MEYQEFFSEITNLSGELLIKYDCSTHNFKQTDETCSVIGVFIKNGKLSFVVESSGEICSDTDMCMETNGVFEITPIDFIDVIINHKIIRSFEKLIVNDNKFDLNKIDIESFMSVAADVTFCVSSIIEQTKNELKSLANELTYVSNNMMSGFSERELMIINSNNVNYYGYDEYVEISYKPNIITNVTHKEYMLKKSLLRSLETTNSIINKKINKNEN